MGLSVFSLSWLLPNHYPPWVNFHSELVAFAGLAVLLATLLMKRAQIVCVPEVAVALIALSILPWLQFAAGLVFFAGDAFISSYYILGLATAIAAGYSTTSSLAYKSDGDIHATGLMGIAKMLLFAAMLSSMLGLLQWLGLTEALTTFAMHTESGDRVIANLGQPNQLATLLLMGVASLAFIFERRGVGRVGFFVGVAFLTWCVVLTESRTAVLSGVSTGLFFVYKKQTIRDGLPIRYVLVWMAGLGLAWLALPFVNGFLYLTDGRNIDFIDQNGRALVWKQIIFSVTQAPLAGYGWNQTPVAQAVGAVRYPGDLFFSNAHNVVLDLFAWVGMPLGAVLSGWCGYWFVTRIRWVKTPEALYAMAILLPVAVHSLLEFPFAYAYFLLTAGLLMGVIEAACVAKTAYRVSRRVAGFVLAAIGGIGSYSAYEYLLIEEDYRVARFENLKVGHTPVDYSEPHVLVHTQLASLLIALRQPALPGMDGIQMERLRETALRFGLRPLVYRYALALGLNSDPTAAANQMQVFRGMFGEQAYQRFKMEFRSLQIAKYPELAAVQLP